MYLVRKIQELYIMYFLLIVLPVYVFTLYAYFFREFSYLFLLVTLLWCCILFGGIGGGYTDIVMYFFRGSYFCKLNK